METDINKGKYKIKKQHEHVDRKFKRPKSNMECNM